MRDDGASLIAAERERQVSDEGWTPEHDDEHLDDQLALAAVVYAMPPTTRGRLRIVLFGRWVHAQMLDDVWQPGIWPWDGKCWKPTPDDRVRELVKAGALIAAEIDRIQRNQGGDQ